MAARFFYLHIKYISSVEAERKNILHVTPSFGSLQIFFLSVFFILYSSLIKRSNLKLSLALSIKQLVEEIISFIYASV